jgi:2-methylcitrate dehydratase
MVRWLDFNDTWLAAEWGHPSDNLGAILAVADYLSRKRRRESATALTMREVLLAMTQAHEIQGVLALENALRGEMGYPSALTAATWGFQEVLFRGAQLRVPPQGFGSSVMENILFKISFPAEFHAQTAVEAALKLHPHVAQRLAQIARIVIETQESGKRIIDKVGPLDNPADRDHCLQYMVAVPLIFGRLTASDYEDEVASDPRIDLLREKMEVAESKQFTVDYLDPAKRSIGNSLQVFFTDGTQTERLVVDYPIGHRRRRQEGIPALLEKFERNLRGRIPPRNANAVLELCGDRKRLESTPVHRFMDLFVV